MILDDEARFVQSFNFYICLREMKEITQILNISSEYWENIKEEERSELEDNMEVESQVDNTLENLNYNQESQDRPCCSEV
jgi:hypothetical protein